MSSKTGEKLARSYIRYEGRTFARRTRLIRNDYAARTKKTREEAIERLKALPRARPLSPLWL